MKLRVAVDNLDDVDSAYHGLYKERDGKFWLELEDVDSLPRVASLKDENAKFRIKARDAEKAVKDKYGFLDGLDVEEVQAKLDKFPELEAAAAGKLDDAAIQKLVDGRLATSIAPIKRDLDKAKQTITERDAEIAGFKTKDRTRAIHDSVREAIGKTQGFQGAAVEDALIFAERMMDIDEDGKVFVKDNVGITPGIDPTVWLTEMQAKKPHWWGTTGGGGASGDRGNGANGAGNPWSKEGWNLTHQGQILRQNPTRAEQMAKSAGVRIGAVRPRETAK